MRTAQPAPCVEKALGGQLLDDAVMLEGCGRASEGLRRLRYRHKLSGRFHIVEALYQSLDAFFIRPAQLQQLTDLIRDTYTLQLEFSLGRVKI